MEENQSVQGGFKKESFLGNFRWERLIAVMLLLGGIWLSRDYGTFWDSIFERRNGLVSLSYSLDCLGLPQPEGLPPLPKMEMSISRHYGVLINLPMAVLEIYGKKSPDQMIQIRNATVFVIFWLGGVILFLYFRKTLSSLVGWGVLLFYGLSPRIFGEAFFNSKDLLFCVFFMIGLIKLEGVILKCRLRSYLEFGCWLGMIASLRVIGFILFMVFIVQKGAEALNKRGQREVIVDTMVSLCLTAVSALGIFILLNPYLWVDTAERLMECLFVFGIFDFPVTVLFWGKNYLAYELPRTYLLTQIAITTPLWMIFGIIMASASVVYKIFGKRKIQRLSLISFFLFWGIIVLQFWHHRSIYDGWRHFYFLWGPAVLMVGFESGDWFVLMKNISFKRCFGVALLIGFLSNLLTIQKLHPYQNLYFSILAGKHPEKQFEVDFWGTTHLEALKKLILRKPEGEILLSVNSDWNYSALLGLPQEERIRFRIVPSAQAQYCIDDFRFREKKLYGSEIFRIEREGTPYLIVLEQKLDPVVSFPESVLPSRSETLTNLLNLRKEEIR